MAYCKDATGYEKSVAATATSLTAWVVFIVSMEMLFSPNTYFNTPIGEEYSYNNALVLLWQRAKIRPSMSGLRTLKKKKN